VRALVLGGIRSGKSQWAEGVIATAASPNLPVHYLATGTVAADDPDWSARICAHRDRRPAHWSTIESQDVSTQLRADCDTATLVDDIGGWLVAVMNRRDAWTDGTVSQDVDDLVAAVGAFRGPLTLVSPEVGLTVVPATLAGRRFADELGVVNQRLAAQCDRVVLVVAGQPLTVKDTSTREELT
jgi:adenosylcobinamide kinase/adenosylcobinamide-phosphate guanylyltransferase